MKTTTDKYILNEQGEPVAEHDLHKWGAWLQSSPMKRAVKKETFGDAKVSTVFLGLDHNYGEGEPILWETMVFSGPLEGEQDRCSGTRADAEQMHARMVKRVEATQ